MNSNVLIQDLEQSPAEVPIIDIHTHLIGGVAKSATGVLRFVEFVLLLPPFAVMIS